MSQELSSTFDALQAHFAKKTSPSPARPSSNMAPVPGGPAAPPTPFTRPEVLLADSSSKSATTPAQQNVFTDFLLRPVNDNTPAKTNLSWVNTGSAGYVPIQPRPAPLLRETAATALQFHANRNVATGSRHVEGQKPLSFAWPGGDAATEEQPPNAKRKRGRPRKTGQPRVRLPGSRPNLANVPDTRFSNDNFPTTTPEQNPSFRSSHSDNSSLIAPDLVAGTDDLAPVSSNQVDSAEEEDDPVDYITDPLLEMQNDLQNDYDSDDRPPLKRHKARRASSSHFERKRESRRPARGNRGGPRKRGPRKAAEPTGDVKYRIHMASNAYMDGQLDKAIEWVEDAIRINAETYRAWALLASFLEEKGDHKGSFTARVFSCHLEPKNVDGWSQCAEIGIALRDEFPDDAEEYHEQAMFCYSQALRANIEDRPARHGRAALAFERGQTKTAAKDYLYLVERCYFDVYALRGLAEMSVLLAHTGKREFEDRPHTAIHWYRRCISHLRENGMDLRYPFDWQDIKIFVELLAYVEQTKDAIYELKSLSRWLLGRSDEAFWDDWQDDDREWDVDKIRRLELAEYRESRYPESSYGSGLPLEFRAKFAIYRLNLDDMDEAMHHLEYLDPEGPNASQLLSEEPHLMVEVASALYEADCRPLALRFYEPLLHNGDVLDGPAFLAAGRCFLDAGDKRQAEECFTATLDAEDSNDEASIDARYELAKMYEAAREEREAYILVNEAIKLQQAQEARDDAQEESDEDEDENEEDEDEDNDDEGQEEPLGGFTGVYPEGARPGNNKVTKTKRSSRPKEPKKTRVPRPPRLPRPKKERQLGPTRRRPKVFARADELEQEEKRRSDKLAEAWHNVHRSRMELRSDDLGPSELFMSSAKELVEDFRSYKNFYSWDKYLAHLGINQERDMVVSRNRNLLEMKERLSHNLNPHGPSAERKLGERTAISYRGVPFNDWLELFLEYAVSLAHYGKYQDAYKVCEYARDAEVFAKSREDMFLLHVTWAACALRGRDEEACVAAARYLMRENQFDTDPFRMFAALSRLCPSPASWYASGPVQKYILRQIKRMDRALGGAGGDESGDEDGAPGKAYPAKDLDVTLLMLYGHILFISNSFTYALNYFLRAYSIDPTNTMAALSVGHCYVHYALKRQSENRQYLLIQGFMFLHQYYNAKVASPEAAIRQEAHYNLARSYHAIGIPHIAAEYYRRTLQEVPDDSGNGIMGRDDLSQEAAFNLQQICLTGGDMESVRSLAEKYLVL
ncbi:hypothetical protein F5X99DRAFT_368242 [Biscogniauxia marginata]|nr:hypothetical protein F5X99DRAFT_368242 [Biscogniauxia marginata]